MEERGERMNRREIKKRINRRREGDEGVKERDIRCRRRRKGKRMKER